MTTIELINAAKGLSQALRRKDSEMPINSTPAQEVDPRLLQRSLCSHNATSAPSRTTCAEPEFNNAIEELIKERGKVYGDPKESHTNIGLTWTALIQQHYGITLEHPIPPELVAQMMVCFKMQRAAKVFKDDNYDDAAAYLKFAREFQCPTHSGDPKTP